MEVYSLQRILGNMTMEDNIIFSRPANLLAIAGGNLVAPPAALFDVVSHCFAFLYILHSSQVGALMQSSNITRNSGK